MVERDLPNLALVGQETFRAVIENSRGLDYEYPLDAIFMAYSAFEKGYLPGVNIIYSPINDGSKIKVEKEIKQRDKSKLIELHIGIPLDFADLSAEHREVQVVGAIVTAQQIVRASYNPVTEDEIVKRLAERMMRNYSRALIINELNELLGSSIGKEDSI